MAITTFDQTILQYIEQSIRNSRLTPLFLGGTTASGGGAGSPPGGYIGYLPQTRIAYDLSEIAASGFAGSGMSILDNLNHIRYRIDTLESAASGATTTFLELTDTPSSYTGNVGKAVVVNGTEDGLEFTTISGGGGQYRQFAWTVASGGGWVFESLGDAPVLLLTDLE